MRTSVPFTSPKGVARRPCRRRWCRASRPGRCGWRGRCRRWRPRRDAGPRPDLPARRWRRIRPAASGRRCRRPAATPPAAGVNAKLTTRAKHVVRMSVPCNPGLMTGRVSCAAHRPVRRDSAGDLRPGAADSAGDRAAVQRRRRSRVLAESAPARHETPARIRTVRRGTHACICRCVTQSGLATGGTRQRGAFRALFAPRAQS